MKLTAEAAWQEFISKLATDKIDYKLAKFMYFAGLSGGIKLTIQTTNHPASAKETLLAINQEIQDYYKGQSKNTQNKAESQ